MRPLVRTARPVARDLAPAVHDLGLATPQLSSAFGVLDRVANQLAYDAPGPVRPYLFWLAWFAHNGNSVLSTGDAHAAVFRAESIFSCPAFQASPTPSPR